MPSLRLTRQTGRAEALAGRLPPLLVAAERVAATVAQGVHGRRRAGVGESFWQFRRYQPGDSVQRIDWRQTAKGQSAFLRDQEWEASQTVLLWRDGGPAMAWRSSNALPTKLDRATLLLLALASLLVRAGERVSTLDGEAAPTTGRGNLERLAAALLQQEGSPDGLPPVRPVPRNAEIVIASDFLGPLDRLEARIAEFRALGARGHLVQVLDPAEIELPFKGRVRFEGLRGELDCLVPRVEALREAYSERLADQQAGLAALARAAGWGLVFERTDRPPEPSLLALYQGLGEGAVAAAS